MTTVAEQVARDLPALQRWSDKELQDAIGTLSLPSDFVEAGDRVGAEAWALLETSRKVRRIICAPDNRKFVEDAIKDGVTTGSATAVVTWLMPLLGLVPGAIVPVGLMALAVWILRILIRLGFNGYCQGVTPATAD